jgi:hypothetical protein
VNVIIHIPIITDPKPVVDFINRQAAPLAFISDDLTTVTCDYVGTANGTYKYANKNHLTFHANEENLSNSALRFLPLIKLDEFYKNNIFEPQHDYTWINTYWYHDRSYTKETYDSLTKAYTVAKITMHNCQSIEIKGIPPQKEK